MSDGGIAPKILFEDASAVPQVEEMVRELRGLIAGWVARGVAPSRAVSLVLLAIARCMADARYPCGDVLGAVARVWADARGQW